MLTLCLLTVVYARYCLFMTVYCLFVFVTVCFYLLLLTFTCARYCSCCQWSTYQSIVNDFFQVVNDHSINDLFQVVNKRLLMIN